MWLSGISGHGAGGLASQLRSTIKTPWVVHCHKSAPILIWPYCLARVKNSENERAQQFQRLSIHLLKDTLSTQRLPIPISQRFSLYRGAEWSQRDTLHTEISTWPCLDRFHRDTLHTEASTSTCGGTLHSEAHSDFTETLSKQRLLHLHVKALSIQRHRVTSQRHSPHREDISVQRLLSTRPCVAGCLEGWPSVEFHFYMNTACTCSLGQHPHTMPMCRGSAQHTQIKMALTFKMLVCLLLFYVLATFKVISGWVPDLWQWIDWLIGGFLTPCPGSIGHIHCENCLVFIHVLLLRRRQKRKINLCQ